MVVADRPEGAASLDLREGGEERREERREEKREGERKEESKEERKEGRREEKEGGSEGRHVKSRLRVFKSSRNQGTGGSAAGKRTQGEGKERGQKESREGWEGEKKVDTSSN